ncbi:MAG: histidine--tRNA ligase [Candidatus Heimdallarchaeaceae archaeon]
MDSELKEVLKGIKGFRDFYPEDYAEYKVIFNAIHSISRLFGYEEYEGPTIEFEKLIEYKSGQELLSETFRLTDREKRKLILRPEMTPTLARLVVNQHQRYPKPMRWYSIPRIFRDETPQKGRVKEHYQFNADIIGVDHPAADAEIIALTTAIIKKSGLRDGEFVCVINSRELLQSYIEQLGVKNYLRVIKVIDARAKYLQESIEKGIFKDQLELKTKNPPTQQLKEYAMQLRTIWQRDPNLTQDYSRLRENAFLGAYLEKLQWIEERSFTQALKKIELSSEQIEKLYSFVSIKGEPKFVINKLQKLNLNEKSMQALNKLEDLSLYLENYNVIQNCEYNLSIARGLDYYTGIVFEFFDTTGSVVRAIAGGGRYDQLVKNFGGGVIPCTGIGMGETVLHAVLKDLGRFEPYTSPVQIYVAPINKEVVNEAITIANKLREQFSVIINPFSWTLKKQLEDAANRKIPLVVIVGKRDLEDNKVTLRDLETGEQKLIKIDKIVSEIRKQFSYAT